MRAWLAVAALLAAPPACARPASPPEVAPAPAVPLSAAEEQAFAELLRVEDRRDRASPLIPQLAGHPSARVRGRAAIAMARLRHPPHLPLLTGLLADPDTSVAAAAAFALGQLADSAAAPHLAARLPSAAVQPTVASEAAYALGKLRSREAADSLAGFLARAEAVPALGPVVGSALLAVWRFPRPADLAPVARWLQSPDPELRWRAAYALSRRPDPRATPLLREHVDDPDPRVRALAVRGLAAPLADSSGLGSSSTLDLVVAALDDEDYAVRINAARALGSYRQPAAAAALVDRVERSEEPHLRVAALEALGRLGASAATAAPLLNSVAVDADDAVAVRVAALDALVRTDSTAARAAAARLLGGPEWRLRASAGRALATLTGPDAPALRTALADADGRVVAATLASLVESTDDASLLRALLVEHLGAADVMVRTAALDGLARLRDPATLPLLISAFALAQRDSLNDAALAAVDAIAALEGPGLDPGRALFARVPEARDYLVRLRAEERFGAAAVRAWGSAFPLETGRSREEYARIVRDLVAPVYAGAPEPEVVLHGQHGAIRLRLFAADAPLTVESFLRLSRRGYFDGQAWPRVVPNFVIQGGDPRGDTSGGPGYTLRDEINRHRYGTGTLGMALSGPDTGGSQFFVTHSPQPHLDGIYTVFGEVVEGQSVAERILPGERILQMQQGR